MKMNLIFTESYQTGPDSWALKWHTNKQGMAIARWLPIYADKGKK